MMFEICFSLKIKSKSSQGGFKGVDNLPPFYEMQYFQLDRQLHQGTYIRQY